LSDSLVEGSILCGFISLGVQDMADKLGKLEAEVELLNGTLKDLSESIERLKEQRDKLTAEIRAKEERLLTWNARLGQLMNELEDPFGAKPKPRRRKGENLRAVRELLATNKDRGLSVTEVTEKLGIAWSSARRTLQKNPIFEERDNLWFLKQSNRNGNDDEKESFS
jgi:chromosome segregation ATPase